MKKRTIALIGLLAAALCLGASSGAAYLVLGTAIPTGMGAVDHVLGPSDQDLSLQAGTGRNTILADNAGTTQATVSTFGLKGRFLGTDYVTFFEDFTQDTINMDYWAEAADAGQTSFAIAEALGGTIVGGPDNEANDAIWFAGPIIYSTSKVTYFETRISIDNIATVAINVGLSDAKSEAAQTMPWIMGGGDALTTTTDDGVGFVFDTGADTDGWYGIISGTTDEKQGAGATVPVNGTFVKLAFLIDSDRKVTFYINDVVYGAKTTAALDSATLLCPMIAGKALDAVARNITVDYVYIAQAR